jgi:hypothetical protein
MLLHHTLNRLGFSEEQIETIMNKDLFLGKRDEIASREANKTGIRLDVIPDIGLINFLYKWEMPEKGGTGASDSLARGWIETMFRLLKKENFNLKINYTFIPSAVRGVIKDVIEKMHLAPPKSRKELLEILKRGPFAYMIPGHQRVAYGLNGNNVLILDPLGGRKLTQSVDNFLKNVSLAQWGVKNHFEVWPVGEEYEHLGKKRKIKIKIMEES